MKYKGIEIKEFKSNKPVGFNPPKKMLVWNFEDDASVQNDVDVYAYLPEQAWPVKCSEVSWRHCAEIPEAPKPRRVTNRELSKWLAQGNGEVSGKNSSGVWTEHVYDKDEMDEACSEHVVIRKWNDTEWHEPAADYMGLEG